jgi:hypothetical protein
MPNKKGQIAEGAIFWIFYIMMTGVIIYFIVSTPSSVFSRATNTQNLENAIFSERIYAKAGWQSPLTWRNYEGTLPTKAAFSKQGIENAFKTSGTPRQLAMKVTLGTKTAFFHESDYNQWEPLSPVLYQKFTEVRPIFLIDSNKIESLTIEQIYAPVPPGGFK